jgi:hypothetical protein
MRDVQGEQPRYLICQQGEWTLELEVLVPIGHVILRPSRKSVSGADKILFHLSQDPALGELTATARQLLEQPQEAEVERCFEVRGGGWASIPADLRQELAAEEQTVAGEAATHQQDQLRLHDLEQRLAAFGQLDQKLSTISILEQRVASLEKLARERAHQAPTTSAPAAVALPAMEDLPPTPHPGDPAATEGGPEPGPAEPGPAEPNVEEPAAQPEAAAALPITVLPEPEDLEELLQMLLGEEIEVSKEDEGAGPSLERAAVTRNLYLSKLIDDDGATVGALVADIPAVVYLGGTMLMVPEASQETMIKTKKVEEEVIDALAEVFNSMCSLINKIEANAHVRSTPASSFRDAEEEDPWLAQPGARTDLILGDSRGRLIMLLRPEGE